MAELGGRALLVSSTLTLPHSSLYCNSWSWFLSPTFGRGQSPFSLSSFQTLLCPFFPPPPAIYRVYHDLIEQQNYALPC